MSDTKTRPASVWDVVELGVYCVQERRVIGHIPIYAGNTLDVDATRGFKPVSGAYHIKPANIRSFTQVLCPRCKGVLHVSRSPDGIPADGEDPQLLVPNNLMVKKE